MSGHNKWSSIKHKKAREDAKKGKVFSKMAKEIAVAARIGGGDPSGNVRLKSAVQAARAVNMPKDNIEQAILRGTGEMEGVEYQEIQYEGYGPGGIALFIETMTDNRNRTTAEIRHILTKHNGNLGESGCVSWVFERKGHILVNPDFSEESLMEVILELDVEDMIPGEEHYEVFCAEENLSEIHSALLEKGVPVVGAERAMIPTNSVDVDPNTGDKLLRLLEILQDHDDVQNVWVNANFVE